MERTKAHDARVGSQNLRLMVFDFVRRSPIPQIWIQAVLALGDVVGHKLKCHRVNKKK
jgi:hypothetical protein